MNNARRTQVIALAESSADCAIDQSGPGREYGTLDDAVAAYLNNIDDTMREWGITATRDFVAARTYFCDALKERGCSRRWVKS